MLGPSPEARSPSLEPGSDVEGVVERACNQQTGGLVILVLAEEYITSGSADHGVPVARGPAPRRERQNSGRPSNRCPNAPSRPNAMLHLANHPLTVASRLPTISVVHPFFFACFFWPFLSYHRIFPARHSALPPFRPSHAQVVLPGVDETVLTYRPPAPRSKQGRLSYVSCGTAPLTILHHRQSHSSTYPRREPALCTPEPQRQTDPPRASYTTSDRPNASLVGVQARLDPTRLTSDLAVLHSMAWCGACLLVTH